MCQQNEFSYQNGFETTTTTTYMHSFQHSYVVSIQSASGLGRDTGC